MTSKFKVSFWVSVRTYRGKVYFTLGLWCADAIIQFCDTANENKCSSVSLGSFGSAMNPVNSLIYCGVSTEFWYFC